MTQAIHGLTLPEICADIIENYERAWTRFEQIAVANKWENGRDAAILPTLLRGKLIDLYSTLTTAEKADTDTRKIALADRAGLTKAQH